MQRPRRRLLPASIAFATVASTWASLAAHAFSRDPDVATGPESTAPVHGFAQLGLGLVELANVRAGAYLGRHLTVEGMAAWDGVYGGHYGGGLMYAFGYPRGRRPPRNALVVGARVMFDSDVTLHSHGDDLNSYGVVPVGYSFLSDGGFCLLLTLGPALTMERTTSIAASGSVSYVHHFVLGGPLFNFAAGYAF